jgi:hypothetical protein
MQKKSAINCAIQIQRRLRGRRQNSTICDINMPTEINSKVINQITVEEAEIKHAITDPILGNLPVPFGFQNKEWLQFKNKLQPGDILVEFFEPPPPNEMHSHGGLEITRKGQVVAQLVTTIFDWSPE